MLRTSGEEYLITLTGVNNKINVGTENEKTIPLNFIASVSDTGNIGTSSNDYYNARNSKTTSIYTLTESGKVSEGQYIIAGYIRPGVAEVNGSIQIKAYIDGDKIAISDTLENGAINVPGYDNGTTSNWVNGRTVLTTTEWNNLQSNPVSFKIKAEDNEGIWVPETDNSTPAS